MDGQGGDFFKRAQTGATKMTRKGALGPLSFWAKMSDLYRKNLHCHPKIVIDYFFLIV